MTILSSRAGARRRSIALGTSALVALAASGQSALAQIDRVVVTAEFRPSTVENTPLSITAVDAAMLEARSQTNIFQVGDQAPNVVLKQAGAAQGGSAMIAFIRGIGQTDFNYALDPGVGLYVDDVYFPTLTGGLVELLDVDRVEILRGPQGTLAGKNSIGGAIKLYTARPGGEDSGRLSATYGEYNRTEVRGSANFTLVEDKLYASLAGVGRTVDGYVTRYDYRCTHPTSVLPTYVTGNGCELGNEGGQSLTAIRGSLLWQATPNLTLTLIADATHEDSEVRASVLRRANGTGAPFAVSPVPIFYDANSNGVFDAGLDVPHDCRFVPFGPNSCDPNPQGRYANYATYLNERAVAILPGQDPWKPLSVDPITTFDEQGISLTADWDLGRDFSLKSVTAYRQYTSEFAEATDLSPLGVTLLLQRLEHDQFQQELRLYGSLAYGAVDFRLGGFYFEQDGTLEARVSLDYVALDFIHGPDPTPSTNKSVFLSSTWHVTDQLNLTGGIRYSDDKKTYVYQRHNPDGTLPAGPCMGPPGAPVNPANCAVFGVNNLTATFADDRFDFRAVADYRWTDSLMTYVQYSTGYKSGGVNPRPFVPDQAQPFNPETVDAYEAGFKSFWFDRRVRLNGAVFHNEYQDIQLTFTTCPASSAPVPCAWPQNAGDAEVRGLELELELEPTDGLIIDGALGLIDFEYQTINPNTGIAITTVPPYTPATTWSGGIQYEFDLGGNGSLTPRIDATYQSHVFSAPANAATSRIDSHTVLNGRLTYRSPDNDWVAALEVRNLTDEYYFLTVFDQPSIGYTAAQPGWPRTWAFTITRNF
jgi:iron complex outermembrane receptor protein